MTNSRNNNAGAGTQTAALTFGDANAVPVAILVEENDVTSWTAGGNLPIGKRQLGAAGAQTAALAFAGQPIPEAPVVADAFSYDGTSWTAVGSMANARRQLQGCGTQTSALAAGGNPNSGSYGSTDSTEEFTGGPIVVTKTVTGT
jgi:hypothetical protein